VSTSERPRPSRFAISRDTLSFLGGWYLIIYQAQFAQDFNLSVFLGGMVIAGVPGVLQVFAARSGVPPTGGSSSSSAPPASPGPSSS
jgi:hypothetical protein